MSMTETNNQERRIVAKLDEAPPPSMELATRRTGGVVFSNFGQVIEFAREMSIADVGVRKHLRGKVGACIAVITQAIEWEMSPFAVASKSYVVNEQIAYEAQLLNAVILRRAPIVGRFKISYSGEGKNRTCTVALAMRDGTPDASYTSPPISQISPQNSPLWKTDPDQQQFYYSSRSLCRRHFPDVLLGVYAVDELIDSELEPPTPRGNAPKSLEAKLDALAADRPHDPETGEIIEHEQPSPALGAATEPAGGVSAPAEAASQPLEGVAASPPGAAAPSDAEVDPYAAREALIAQVRRDGQARAEAGTAALTNYLEQLRQDGNHGLVTAVIKTAWHDAAKAADAKRGAK
jgi:hypothetical protein